MGRFIVLQIAESEAELLSLQKAQKDLRNFKKLECLLHLKRGTYTKLEEVAQSVSISPSTLDKWIKLYKQSGIDIYLRPIKGKRSSKLFTPEIREGLIARLKSEDKPFKGFNDVKKWIADKYGVEVQYQWLWKYMTTKLNIQLKDSKLSIKKER